jgi:DNA-binding winged helix-turn-helix (wHTH) protein
MTEFPPFRLDSPNQCLWRIGDAGREERILLTPKAFAVLLYLVQHAGQLVTHEELLEAVWAGSVVEAQAVKRNIREVRNALGDRPKNSVFIETLTKRGYRFIAPVSERITPSPSVPVRPAHGKMAQSALVGRGPALEELHEAWQRASGGERQIVFIAGEPGIGKTALAAEFSRQVAVSEQSVRIARGQCIEGYGSKEAYGPMLEALSQLCRGPQAGPIVQILSAEAPTWLAQLQGYSRASTARCCSGRSSEPLVTACCARSVRRWIRSPQRLRCYSCWRTCTGWMTPPWISSPQWRAVAHARN